MILLYIDHLFCECIFISNKCFGIFFCDHKLMSESCAVNKYNIYIYTTTLLLHHNINI